MADVKDPGATQSRASEIDRQLDDLVAKMVEGSASPQEITKYQELLSNRTRLLRPSPRSRFTTFDRKRFAHQA
jgi:hypothetical protein